jgi:hypothetical protein
VRTRRSVMVLLVGMCGTFVVACADSERATGSARTQRSCPGFDNAPSEGGALGSGKGDLARAVRTFVSTIRGAGSHDYTKPGDGQPAAFAKAWRDSVAQPTNPDALAPFGYALFFYEDTGDDSPGDGSNRWVVACEVRNGTTGWKRGWGLYLSNGPGHTTVIEVPHPRFDADAEDIGVAIARQTGGDVLIAGAHRNANNEFGADACRQDDACADMSHQDTSMFQAVHDAIINPPECPGTSSCATGFVVVQTHGFATRLHQGIGDIALSNGTPNPISPGSLMDVIADDLDRGSFKVCRFEAPRDCAGTTGTGTAGSSLGATKNVQGLSARGATAPVAFIHVEVSNEVRAIETGDRSRRKVGEIIGSAVGTALARI